MRADLTNRRDTVLGRMRDVGYMTAERARGRGDRPLDRRPGQGRPGLRRRRRRAPFFCDYVRHELEDTADRRGAGADQGGAAEQAVRRRAHHPHHPGPADPVRRPEGGRHPGPERRPDAGSPRPPTSSSRAPAPSGRWPSTGRTARTPTQGETQINLATGGTHGVQPGSTFKPFFLAAALQQGIPLATQIVLARAVLPTEFAYKSADGKAAGRSATPATARRAPSTCAPARTTRSTPSTSSWPSAPGWRSRWRWPRRSACARCGQGRRQAAGPGLPSGASAAPRRQPAGDGRRLRRVRRARHVLPAAGGDRDHRAGRQAASPVPANPARRSLEPGVADTVTSVLTGVIDGSTGPDGAARRSAAPPPARPAPPTTATPPGSSATPRSSPPRSGSGTSPNPQPMTRHPHQQPPLPAGVRRDAAGADLAADDAGGARPLPVKGFQPADPVVAAATAAPTGPRSPTSPARPTTRRSQAHSPPPASPGAGRDGGQRRSPAGRVAYTSPRAGRSATGGARSSSTARAAAGAERAPTRRAGRRPPRHRAPRPGAQARRRTTGSAAPAAPPAAVGAAGPLSRPGPPGPRRRRGRPRPGRRPAGRPPS